MRVAMLLPVLSDQTTPYVCTHLVWEKDTTLLPLVSGSTKAPYLFLQKKQGILLYCKVLKVQLRLLDTELTQNCKIYQRRPVSRAGHQPSTVLVHFLWNLPRVVSTCMYSPGITHSGLPHICIGAHERSLKETHTNIYAHVNIVNETFIPGSRSPWASVHCYTGKCKTIPLKTNNPTVLFRKLHYSLLHQRKEHQAAAAAVSNIILYLYLFHTQIKTIQRSIPQRTRGFLVVREYHRKGKLPRR